MKVQIIGAGAVGSQIAHALMRLADSIHLVDIDPKILEGQLMDLNRAKVINDWPADLNGSTVIYPHGFDFNIISLGARCDYGGFPTKKDAITDLYTKNWRDVYLAVRAIRSGEIIIVTNPAKMITTRLNNMFPKKKITHAGDLVDIIEDGEKIQRQKGYTNFGIAAEISAIINNNKMVGAWLKAGEVSHK